MNSTFFKSLVLGLASAFGLLGGVKMGQTILSYEQPDKDITPKSTSIVSAQDLINKVDTDKFQKNYFMLAGSSFTK